MSYRQQKRLLVIVRKICLRAYLLFIVLSAAAFGETEPIMRFEHVTIDPNFNRATLIMMIQDRYGFIWLATMNGLYRYDGYEFKRFHHIENDSTSLPINSVKSVVEDSKGSIWVGTKKKYLCKFDRNTEKFTNYQIPDNIFPSLGKSQFYLQIIKGLQDELWIISHGQIIRFDVPTKVFKIYLVPHKKSIANFYANQLFLDSQNQLWALANSGIYKYRNKTDQFEQINTEPLNSLNKIWSMYEDHEHNYWFGSNQNSYFYQYDPNHQSIQTFRNQIKGHLFKGNVNRILSFCEDNRGNLWLGNTYNGLGLLDKKNGKILNSVEDNGRFTGIDITHVQCLLKDHSGTMWIANTSTGLYKQSPSNKFETIQKKKNSSNSISSNHISDLFQDRSGNVWIGTGLSGLDVYNPRMNIYTHYQNNPKDSLSLDANSIYKIFQDQSGSIWIGTTRGLNRFDPSTEHFEHYTFTFKTLLKNDNKTYQHINSIYQDSDHTLWLGSSMGGLIEFHPESKKYQVYSSIPINDILVNKIQSICEDDKENIWVGAYGYGLRVFNKKQKRFIKEFRYDPDNSGSIPNEYITCIFKDKKNNIWIGTILGGISKYDWQTDSFIKYTEKDGLSSNDIYDIAEDDYSYLWLATQKGLSKYNPANSSFTNYGEKDCLNVFKVAPEIQNKDLILSFGVIDKLSNGDFLVGGPNGIARFNPLDIAKPANTSPLYLTHFKVFNKELDITQPFWLTKELHLTYKDYIFSFEFSQLDFVNPGNNQYAYYLEGFEKDWNPVSTQRIVQYMNVPPGHYTFRVKAANSDGIWSNQQLAVRVFIKPPYWKTLWFNLSVVLLLCLIVLGGFHIRLVAINRQRIELENTVTERTLELNEKRNALQIARDELEHRVIERTAELAQTNKEFLKEITERKRTEYALQNSEQTTRALLNAPPDSAVLLSPDGRILAINESFLKLIGKSDQRVEDYLGLTIFGFNPSERLVLRKDYFQKCIQSRKPVQFEDISNKHTFTHFLYPITDSEGGISAIALFTRDVTDQKEAEKILKRSKEDLEILVTKRTSELNKTNQQLVNEIKIRKQIEENLRVSEEQFRDLFENANDAIWTTDLKGNFTSVNIFLESLMGYSKDDLLKMNPIDIVAPEHRFRLTHNFLKVAHGQSSGIEIDVLPKEGNRKILWLRFRPIWSHSDVVGIHGIGRDITNLRKTEDNLKRAENQKRESLKEVTLKIAHEIKNPLASIKSSAQLVLSSPEYGEIPNIKRHMEIINRNTDVCNLVIRELYNFTTQLEFKVTQIGADNFIDKLATYATQKAGVDRQIQIIVNKDPQFVSFEGDEFRLIQVFNNIINNAVEAIHADGKIIFDVCLKNAGKIVTFAIKDTGEGISESNLKNIFKPFFTSKVSGFGLGLTYAREIIKFHDGDIEVSSEVGKGTTFQIKIPVKQEKKI